MDKGKKKIIRDLSGKPERVNTGLLNSLLNQGYTPILTVPIIDENGYAINSENDDIVALLQKSYKAETVVHLIESAGFLIDPEDERSVIKKMNRNELIDWEQKAEGRIKRKLYSLKKMFAEGVVRVVISDGRIKQPLTSALSGIGTVIR